MRLESALVGPGMPGHPGCRGVAGCARPGAADSRKGRPIVGSGRHQTGEPRCDYGRMGRSRIRDPLAGRRRPRLGLPARHPGAPPGARCAPARLWLTVQPPGPAAGQRSAGRRDLSKPMSPAPPVAAPGRHPGCPVHGHGSARWNRGWPKTRQARASRGTNTRRRPTAARLPPLKPPGRWA